MVVGILRVFDRVIDQLLQCVALANELDELGVAATTAKHHKPVLLV